MFASQGLQPFTLQRSSTRPGRSVSNVSTSTTGSYLPRTTSSSRSSSQTRSIRAVPPPVVPRDAFYASSIDGVLSRAVNSSCASLASISLDSVRSESRPAAFSSLERNEERAEFGDRALAVLEPRDTLGWWGFREVLESDALESSIIA